MESASEWGEAATNLGASSSQYWRWVALPILWPALLGAFVLLFGSAFAAYATAVALLGSQINLVPIVIGSRHHGRFRLHPQIANALALGMIVIIGVVMMVYACSSAGQQVAAAMRRGRSEPLGHVLAGAAALYFLVPLYRHRGVQPGAGQRAAMASTYYQTDPPGSGLQGQPPALAQAGGGTVVVSTGADGADRLLGEPAAAEAAAGARLHRRAAVRGARRSPWASPSSICSAQLQYHSGPLYWLVAAGLANRPQVLVSPT